MTEPAKAVADFTKPVADFAEPVVFYVAADGKLRHDLSTPEIRDVIQKGTGELWIDMRVTSRQCIAMLDNVFAFHPLAIEDALNPKSRVKVDEYPGFLFAIVRGIRLNAETDEPYDSETFNISFFLGANYLVTVHGGESPAFASVA